MADKTYKLNISKSDGSFSDSVQFTIPQREGTYKIEFELSNGNKVNAGNISVSTVEKTYKAEFQLSDGNTIDGGTFTTPVAQGWRTVWTGSEVVSAARVKTGTKYAAGLGYLGETTSEKSIISSAYPTRITYLTSSSSTHETKTVTGSNIVLVSFSGIAKGNISARIGENNVIIFTTTVYGDKANSFVRVTENVTLTKVEQFY